MQEDGGALSRMVGRPLLAATLAIVIVFAIGALAGSKVRKLEPAFATTQVGERVALTKTADVYMANAPLNGSPQSAAAGAPKAAKARLGAPQIARRGKVSLFVGGVDAAVTSLSRLARRESGDVFSLQVDNAGSSSAKATAEMEIRVPANRFDATMGAIGQVGKVRERSVSAEDLTTNITDSAARLRNLRRTEADIRKIMDRSGSVGQVLDAENQLSQVREQIETLQSDLKSMEGRVAYSTITASIEAESSPAPVEPTALSQLVTAWHAAVHALSQTTVGLIAALLWLLVFVPYFLAASLVAWIVYAQSRKRIRNPA